MKKIEITVELLNDICEKYSRALFEWQKNWKNNQFHRNRILHKGRQVGADWYFSLEALHDAMLTGRNKLFLGEMSECALGYFCGHLNIKHNEEGFFELSNGAQISFIRELETTFSGRFGDVYISEWAWLESPKEWVDIALNITLHDRWRRTFYSSRSEQDNSGDLKYTHFDGDKVNGESTFFDRVNGWDVPEIINVNNMIGHFECHDRWGEEILCKLNY
ncbi:terminase large subunit domain-containing protein [Proteus mirabilis]|uniref:terminase large subunit domain-containing protein n=1 Tax=Proteus mirabilis TaxID=584 RepID=UPI00254EC806|nr:terminase family protein [Proteus mirabilis]MDK7000978.1 hypothetical protein [Proteus mirabilis]MDK7018803.1 hypothetical protein [Proteus mirabilis]MDK8620779.1 hypothetical protein [Proteus mirabilis]